MSHGNKNDRLIQKISTDFNQEVLLFDSGRSALYAILSSLHKDDRDEILIQAYTCVVVVNAIKKAGYKPIYVDTEKGKTNISIDDLKSKVTAKSKAIIVQNIFGFTDEIYSIKKICEENKLTLIEDLAHSLTSTYRGKMLGIHGDAAFLSFGSGKIISSSRGGAVITNNEKLLKRIKKLHRLLKHMPFWTIWRHHFKHIEFAISRPLYFFFNIGKANLYIGRKLRLIPDILDKDEKAGRVQNIKVYKYPNSLATIANSQWHRKEFFKQHRQKIAKIYSEELKDLSVVELFDFDEGGSYMRYPILVKNPRALFSFCKQNHIILGDEWSYSVIVPRSIKLEATGYKKGDCPNAEYISSKILCLPTHISMTPQKAKLITSKIKEFYGNPN